MMETRFINGSNTNTMSTKGLFLRVVGVTPVMPGVLSAEWATFPSHNTRVKVSLEQLIQHREFPCFISWRKMPG